MTCRINESYCFCKILRPSSLRHAYSPPGIERQCILPHRDLDAALIHALRPCPQSDRGLYSSASPPQLMVVMSFIAVRAVPLCLHAIVPCRDLSFLYHAPEPFLAIYKTVTPSRSNRLPHRKDATINCASYSSGAGIPFRFSSIWSTR